ncbi:MAG: mechanosensitive ion channel protein MscS [Planctomycetota bacterium]|nr:MAG: mechanosensitive ion channel protein MscS [Planctomycetota bacterium]
MLRDELSPSWPVILIALVLLGDALVAQQNSTRPEPTAASVELAATMESLDERDSAIAAQLQSIFEQVEELRDVTVSAHAGVVKLSGETSSGAHRARAEELAAKLDGVVYVDNDIAQSTSVSKRVLPTVEALGESVRELLAGVPLLLIALAVMLTFVVVAHLLTRGDLLVGRLAERKLLQGVLRQVIKSVVILVGAFVALDILGATAVVGAVLGAAGVVGLALSFAFRDIVENYLASILLSIRAPFIAKDTVEIDGTVGVVVRLTTAETMLMTFDGDHVRLPNAQVFKSKIINRTRNPKRRFEFVVGVGVDEDLEEAQQLGLDTMAQLPGILDDPMPLALVEALGDSNVAIRFYGWIDQRERDFGKVKSQAIRLVKTVLDEHEIEMPSPTYDINLHRVVRGEATRDEGPSHVDSSSRKRIAEALSEAQLDDTSPDTEIEEQIEAEKATSQEEDLLEPDLEAARH